MNIEAFEQLPLMAILRGIEPKHVESLAKIFIACELPAVEITMNTNDVAALIREMKYYAKGKFSVGAGTVLTFRDLDKAIASGASYIVMPTLQIDVIRVCASQNIPVFPGAFTPTEIYKAWELGATMVKVFPSSVLGPKYFSEIKAPMNDIKLMACGGVSVSTIGDYFNAGASAAAFGASIVKKEWLDTENYDAIEVELKTLVDAYKSLNVSA